MARSYFSRLHVLLFAVALAGSGGSLHASSGGFAATLSVEQQAAAGLPVLSPVEQIVLDELVAGELGAARRTDGAEELPGTFTSRRSEAELKSIGLDRLTPAQLAKLNEYVASALAARPKPKARPRLRDSDVLAEKKVEIHGSLTVGYTWGSGGRGGWGQSLWLESYDPQSRIGIGIGFSNFSGRGFTDCYPGDDYYDGSRYYSAAPVYLDAAYRGNVWGGDPGFGDGQVFRGGRGGGFSGGSFGRR